MSRALKALFPTLIWQNKLPGVTVQLKKDLLHEVNVFKAEDFSGLKWSKQNYPFGYTSYGSRDQLHHHSPTFHQLSCLIRPQVLKFAKTLQWNCDPKSLQLNSLWVNVMNRGAFHSWHIHPRSTISGTFYLQLPGPGSAIRFADPRQALFMHAPAKLETQSRGKTRKASLGKSLSRKGLSAQQDTFVNCSVQEGEIVLFESWLSHEVPCHLGSKPRISVSFNYDFL